MTSKRDFAIGTIGFVAGIAVAGVRTASAGGGGYGSDRIYTTGDIKKEMFKQVLDRIKIKIFPAQWSITTPFFWRDIRDKPFCNGTEYYGLAKQSWYTAIIRCDDVQNADEIDGAADIFFGMYYCPTNVDGIVSGNPGGNPWPPDTPVMAIDSYLAGMYNKQIWIDSKLLRTYRPDPNTWLAGQSFWIRGTKTITIDPQTGKPVVVDDFLKPLDMWPPI